ncbi:hypothetical protein AB9E28_34610, partial [Rhizobium leguminosarum]|uniref:hypothetical protein n=1 Tax=Rhizobium leguminosarum TaxID=384 RepID=UPI003F99CB3B
MPNPITDQEISDLMFVDDQSDFIMIGPTLGFVSVELIPELRLTLIALILSSKLGFAFSAWRANAFAG